MNSSLRLKNYLKGKDEEKIIPEHPSLCNLYQVFCLVFIKFKYQDFKNGILNQFDWDTRDRWSLPNICYELKFFQKLFV